MELFMTMGTRKFVPVEWQHNRKREETLVVG